MKNLDKFYRNEAINDRSIKSGAINENIIVKFLRLRTI